MDTYTTFVKINRRREHMDRQFLGGLPIYVGFGGFGGYPGYWGYHGYGYGGFPFHHYHHGFHHGYW